MSPDPRLNKVSFIPAPFLTPTFPQSTFLGSANWINQCLLTDYVILQAHLPKIQRSVSAIPPVSGLAVFLFYFPVGNAFGSDTIKPMETIAVPDSFYPMLKQFTKVIIKMDLQKLVLHPISNPLLQTLFLVLHMKNQSLCMKLCKAVMSQIDMLKNKTDTRKPNTDDNHQNIKDKR